MRVQIDSAVELTLFADPTLAAEDSGSSSRLYPEYIEQMHETENDLPASNHFSLDSPFLEDERPFPTVDGVKPLAIQSPGTARPNDAGNGEDYERPSAEGVMAMDRAPLSSEEPTAALTMAQAKRLLQLPWGIFASSSSSSFCGTHALRRCSFDRVDIFCVFIVEQLC